MEYSIGEVSAILNLSRDMIRYYEKQGAVSSSRGSDNNYRKYSDMEVFWLLEASQHKSWGIPINEISGIRENGYTKSTEIFLSKELEDLRKEAAYKLLLSRRLDEVREHMGLGLLNIGNYWIARVPEFYRCHLVTGRGDVYDRINMPLEVSRYIFSERCIPFADSGFTVKEDLTEWEMCIKKEYADALDEPVPAEMELFPCRTCLCTNADIGEVGSFDSSAFHEISVQAEKRGLSPIPGADLQAITLGRGYENGRFRRLVRLYLPVM
ncbi:MAG: MerR family transcriptional regulator [Lachnospiraceae bacterium]|nr:MerR family transcriptional regulator [Lachnospiraceae bacterium]